MLVVRSNVRKFESDSFVDDFEVLSAVFCTLFVCKQGHGFCVPGIMS